VPAFLVVAVSPSGCTTAGCRHGEAVTKRIATANRRKIVAALEMSSLRRDVVLLMAMPVTFLPN
jgi:hypothetical protein